MTIKSRLADAQDALTAAQSSLDSAQAAATAAQQAVDKARDDMALWTSVQQEEQYANVQSYGAAEVPVEQAQPTEETPQ